MIKEELQKLIQQALAALGFDIEEISLEHPETAEHGDYSTSVALVLAKKLGKNPKEVAQQIVSNFDIRASDFLDKVEVAGPGFVNFFLSKEYLVKEAESVLKRKEKYGENEALKKKKIIIEFTDPNPFKEFHIGHLYSNIVGETLCKILEANGAVVKRANYQGDIGLHVAKAIWGMMRIPHKPKENDSLPAKTKWLGMCYAAGAIKEDAKKEEELRKINKALYDRSDKDINKLYDTGRKWSLKYFEKIYERLGTKFNFYYFESEVGEIGANLVQENLKKGIFKESEGAIIFPGEKYGLHNRVFINSQGLPTYEAKELGLAPTKYKDFQYDLSIIVTGNEIIDYFKVLIAALKLINPKLGDRTRHVAHGMVRLAEGKMSSRTGNVITGEQLIDQVKAEALHILESSKTESNISQLEKQQIAEAVALGAVKYALLKVSLGKDIIFDSEKSLSLQGDSGPYIQYTYARCKSILRKAKINLAKPSLSKLGLAKLSTEEIALLRLLYRFEEVVRVAAEKFSPNLICNFVFDVAQAYNLFYNTHRVLEAEKKEQREFRLMLTAATAQIIKNSLSLLGISAPERM